MDDEYRQHLCGLLQSHQRRLYELEQQAARFGMNTHPEIRIEIKDIRAEIARIELELDGKNTTHPEQFALHTSSTLSREPRPTNVPVQPTPLVGRVRDVDALLQLLNRTDVRLVTLTGPGGIGKTRLGLQVLVDLLDSFEDGGYFVPLGAISDPSLVVTAIAQVLGVRETNTRMPIDIIEQKSDSPLPDELDPAPLPHYFRRVDTMAGEQSLIARLKAYLLDKQTLLLLDNFEQVVRAAPLVADLLAACSQLKVLVTSRARLRLRGEREFPVSSLALPDLQHRPPLDALLRYSAIELFVEHASAVKPGFAITDENAATIAEICARLEGLPLAIELAAARVKVLSPQVMLARMSSRLKFLVGGPRDLPTRQQTLRGAIDWSYDLLDADEQTLFIRLSVFVGGCTLEAAEHICSRDTDDEGLQSNQIDVLNGLISLVDKSLLQQTEAGDSELRFLMLETIREYALERLEVSEEATALRQRHASYYLALAERAESELKGPRQVVWLNTLESELDNLRAALSWTLDRDVPGMGLRLSSAMCKFWLFHGHLSEGREWLDQMLSRSGRMPAPTLAQALLGAGDLAESQGDYVQARRYYQESLVCSQELGDKRGIATALNKLGHVARNQGNYVQAITHYEESLAIQRELGDKSGTAESLTNLWWMSGAQGNYVQARAYAAESLAFSRELGDKAGIAQSLNNLAWVMCEQGDYMRAQARYKESLALVRELGDKREIAASLNHLWRVAGSQSDYAQARAYAEESLSIQRELGNKSGIASALNNLGWVARILGDYAQAQALYKESLALQRELGDKRGIASSVKNLGWIAVDQGDYAQARTYAEESLTLYRELESKASIANLLGNLGLVARILGDYAQAQALYEESLSIWRGLGHPSGIAISLDNLGHVAGARGDYAEAWMHYEKSLALRRDLRVKPGIAESLKNLWWIASSRGDYAQAYIYANERLSLYREMGDKRRTASALDNLGWVARVQGDYLRAQTFYEESLIIRRELGTRSSIAISLANLGWVACKHGNYAQAQALYEERLTLYRELGSKSGIAVSLASLGWVARKHGDYAQAQAHSEESLRLQRELAQQADVAVALDNVGRVARDQGDYAQAHACYSESLTIRRKIGRRAGIAVSLANLGRVAQAQGDYTQAHAYYTESLVLYSELGKRSDIARLISNLGRLAREHRDYVQAHVLYKESLALRQELGEKAQVAFMLNEFGHLATAQGQRERAAQLFGAAEALRESLQIPLPLTDRAEYEQDIAVLRAQLDEATFAAAWTAGRAMPLESAITEATENQDQS